MQCSQSQNFQTTGTLKESTQIFSHAINTLFSNHLDGHLYAICIFLVYNLLPHETSVHLPIGQYYHYPIGDILRGSDSTKTWRDREKLRFHVAPGLSNQRLAPHEYFPNITTKNILPPCCLVSIIFIGCFYCWSLLDQLSICACVMVTLPG